MTSNVTLQTAQQLSGLMVSRAVHKRCSSRPLKQKASKCHASTSCQRLVTYTIIFKSRQKTSSCVIHLEHKSAQLSSAFFMFVGLPQNVYFVFSTLQKTQKSCNRYKLVNKSINKVNYY